jgi:hypothetical protein
MKPRWLNDIESYVDSIPYGEVVLSVTRINRHTTNINTSGTETLRYDNDNKSCVGDIVSFLAGLMDEEYTGVVEFGVDMRSGMVQFLTIKNTKKTSYDEKPNKKV